jgi:hypothetical protein
VTSPLGSTERPDDEDRLRALLSSEFRHFGSWEEWAPLAYDRIPVEPRQALRHLYGLHDVVDRQYMHCVLCALLRPVADLPGAVGGRPDGWGGVAGHTPVPATQEGDAGIAPRPGVPDRSCYGTDTAKAGDLLYEVAAWLEDLARGESEVDDAYGSLVDRLAPAADAALAEVRRLTSRCESLQAENTRLRTAHAAATRHARDAVASLNQLTT